MARSSPPAFVEVSGLTVPTAALELLLALEDRGITVRLKPGEPGRILVNPAAGLTPADKTALGKYRLHLAALLAAPVPVPIVTDTTADASTTPERPREDA